MTETEWKIFLKEFSRVLIELDENENFPESSYELGYLDCKGATEAKILAAEHRLGIKFPPSYRTFLQVSDGWPEMGASFPGILWPTERIRWLQAQDPELIEIWSKAASELSLEEHVYYRDVEPDSCRFSSAYLQNTLAISDYGDACILLLSPDVVDDEGEWECWKLASWLPGAARYRSFKDWMKSAYEFVSKLLSEFEEDE